MENFSETAIETTASAKYAKRFMASVADFGILWIIGILISLPFTDAFIAMGWKGKAIGFIITLVYFSLCNSYVFKGQTPGQKLFKIKVVNARGETISLARSAIRALVFPILITFNSWKLPVFSDSFALQIVVFISFALFFSEAYFFVFNRKSKQLLHDVITDTCVINADADISKAQFIKSDKAVLRFSFSPIVLVVIMLVLVKILLAQPTMNELVTIQSDLQKTYGLPGMTVGYSRNLSRDAGTEKKAALTLQVTYIKQSQSESNELVSKNVLAVLKKYSLPKEVDAVELRFETGFDIGLASKWKRESRKYAKADYMNAIQ